MTSPDPLCYLDLGGRGPGLIPASAAAVPAGDRGLLYGDGLFETLLVQDGSVPLLPLHLERLTASALALEIPCDREQVELAVWAVAAASGDGESALRITLTRGESPARGYAPPAAANPTLLVTASPYSRPTGPLTAITASLRINPSSPLAAHKTLSALEKVVARAEAARAGVSEALLLNAEGRVAEGAAANLFLVRDGRWITPPVSEGCLPGVMRRRMIEATGAAEAPVTPADLVRAEGLYLTSALMGCMPLRQLDDQPLPAGPPPPSLAELLRL